jgi:hypothetical protein
MSSLIIADVSEFQGQINWPGYGSDIAIVRICYGDLHVDRQADRNIEGARSRCRACGWYCYLVAGRDPVAQANTFSKVLLAHGSLKPNEFIVVDDEESSGADEVNRIDAFLERCDASLNSKSDWWYSGLNFEIAHNLSVAKGHRWIAAYGVSEPLTNHDLWQFTSTGTIAGINGNVDLSIYHGSVDDFISLIGGVTKGTNNIMSGGMVQAAPFDTNRLDLVVIGSDGIVYRSYNPGGAGQIDNQTNYIGVNIENTPPGGWTEVYWCWSSGPEQWRMNIFATPGNESLYLAVIDIAGNLVQGWTKLPITVRKPSGEIGPPGPKYDDTQIKADIASIKNIIWNVKVALG